MRLKCIADQVPETFRPAIALSPIVDARRTFGVQVGETYLVFGLEFRNGLPWAQVEVDPEELISTPLVLFEIVDPAVPSAWEARVLDTGDLVLWPAAFFSAGFHERLYDGDATAKAALERVRRQVDGL